MGRIKETLLKHQEHTEQRSYVTMETSDNRTKVKVLLEYVYVTLSISSSYFLPLGEVFVLQYK